MSMNIKCVCGYVYYRSVFNGDDHIEEGDEPFEFIKGSFYIYDEWNNNEERKVKLYACPKCGTIQMSKY